MEPWIEKTNWKEKMRHLRQKFVIFDTMVPDFKEAMLSRLISRLMTTNHNVLLLNRQQ